MTYPIIFELCVDWDAVDWAADPDFSEDYDNISGDVDADGFAYLSWQRGKEKEEGNAPAGTLEVRLKQGLVEKYSPFTDGVLAGKVRPWLPVRLRVFRNSIYVPVYAGFISSIRIDPLIGFETVLLYCTDGTDLLARQIETQDPANRTIMSDGVAIGRILDAAGWSVSRRNIDLDGGDSLLGFPATTEF